MRIQIMVTVELERETGKFASKDEMAEQLIEEIEGADPGSLTGENEGEYNVVEWTVEAV